MFSQIHVKLDRTNPYDLLLKVVDSFMKRDVLRVYEQMKIGLDPVKTTEWIQLK